jgi:DNA adenine methylase
MSRSAAQSKVTRPAMRYHGGKWKLAEWLLGFFPPHRIYVEPFGGAASVLLQKDRSYGEVYNDIDSEIVNVFRVLRDRVAAAELERLIRLTPYSREEFRAAYEDTADPIEKARRTICRSSMGFGSAAVTKAHKTGFRANTTRTGTTPATDWARYPDLIGQFVERLQGVTVENREAVDVIAHHDSPSTLFYVDPPYPFETRYASAAWKDCYRHELTTDGHRKLALVLRGVRGMVVLSGYSCPLYDELFGDWLRVERKAFADGARERTEVLWLNPKANQGLNQQNLF